MTRAADDFDAIRARRDELRAEAATVAQDEQNVSGAPSIAKNMFCAFCDAQTSAEATTRCHGMCLG